MGQDKRGEENTTQRGALCAVIYTKYYSSDQFQKKEMGWACSIYLEDEMLIQGFCGKTLLIDATCKA